MSGNITKKESNQLYSLVKFIHDTLTKHNIAYWVTGGTLLGAVRHGGLIPWDDDADICIMQPDLPKLKKLVPYFTKHGYDLLEITDEDYKCDKYKNTCSWAVYPTKGGLGCDIFVMKKKGKKITYANPVWEKADNGGKKCYFEENHVFPLVPTHFGNFFVYMPNNPIKHLNTCYDPDWNSHSQMLYDHRLGKWVNSKKKTMKSGEYVTLKAPTTTCDVDVPTNKVCPLSKQYKEKTKAQLYKEAAKKNIPGRSKMSKSELILNIKKH